MSNPIKFLITLLTIGLLSSFASNNNDTFIGTFGVSAADPSQIKLVIHPDHTFEYQDFSNSNKKIAIKGSWTLNGQKVILQDTESTVKFHDVWKISENGQVATSRKGLTFYRLTKIAG